MCSVTGYDASGWVDDLAAEQNKQCTSIAIGKNLLYGTLSMIFSIQLFTTVRGKLVGLQI